MVTLTSNVGTLHVTTLIQLLYDYFPSANVSLYPEVHVHETAFSIRVVLEVPSPSKKPCSYIFHA